MKDFIVPALIAGFLLDALIGDPRWLPHPVRWIGRCVTYGEKAARRLFPDTPLGRRLGGGALVAAVLCLAWGIPALLLGAAFRLSPILRLVLESFWCGQLLAARDLVAESMRVYHRLAARDLPGSRRVVSMIVGRDTRDMTFPEVIRAAVETVAENTADGVVAPLLFIAIGGAPLGFLYKAVNTMDSMLGYRNERYIDFGRCAARVDDAFNWLPARLGALAMVAASGLMRMDAGRAYRIWRRDRRNHPSPNSAQTESVCAGALGVQLGGDSVYGGVPCHKPTIGDRIRPLEAEDIPRANRLMYTASVLCLIAFGLVRLILR